MRAEVIAVGTELLMGYVVNTNSGDISKELLALGIGTYYQQTIGDNPVRMKEAFELAASRSDLVVITGGLGPTHDDVTKQVLAEVVGTTLVEDKAQLSKLETFFQNENRALTEVDKRQVLTLAGGTTLFNHYGLACGSLYQTEKTLYIVLPGPPFEMKQMLKQEVLPRLLPYVNAEAVMASRYLNLYGVGEAQVAILLAELLDNQTNPTIGIYAKPRHVVLRLTANAADEATAQQLLDQLSERLLALVGKWYIGEGEFFDYYSYVLEQVACKEWTLATVETITSGKLAARLKDQAAGVTVFNQGLVLQTTDKLELEAQMRLLAHDKRVVVATFANNTTQAKVACLLPNGQFYWRNIALSQRPLTVQQDIILYEAMNLVRELL